MTDDNQSAVNTLRISSESLSRGRCDNCFRPIVRTVGNKYLHRHNYSDSCTLVREKGLIVDDISIHSGETDKVALYKTVKALHRVIEAHNKLVAMLETNPMAPRMMKDIEVQQGSIRIVDYKGSPQAIDALNAAVALEKAERHQLTPLEAVSFLRQFGWYCRCVGPRAEEIAAGVTLCSICSKPLLDSSND